MRVKQFTLYCILRDKIGKPTFMRWQTMPHRQEAEQRARVLADTVKSMEWFITEEVVEVQSVLAASGNCQLATLWEPRDAHEREHKRTKRNRRRQRTRGRDHA